MPNLEQIAALARAAIEAKRSRPGWINTSSDDWQAMQKAKEAYCNLVDNNEAVIIAMCEALQAAEALRARFAAGDITGRSQARFDAALSRLEALCPSS